MMNREEQIKDTAERFYLNNEQNNYEDERLYQAFIRGAKWADEHPSRDMIEQFEVQNQIFTSTRKHKENNEEN